MITRSTFLKQWDDKGPWNSRVTSDIIPSFSLMAHYYGFYSEDSFSRNIIRREEEISHFREEQLEEDQCKLIGYPRVLQVAKLVVIIITINNILIMMTP